MRVVDYVLRRIYDNEHLSKQITKSAATAEIVNLYNNLVMGAQAVSDRNFYMNYALGDTYGADFKRYITHLPMNEQMRLLDRYLAHFPTIEVNGERQDSPEEEPQFEVIPSTPETPAAKEERQLRHWVVKTMIISCLALTFVAIGAMVAIMVHNHTMPDSLVIKTLMQTATEIAKLLFNSTPSK